jgi:hypothetical protein
MALPNPAFRKLWIVTGDLRHLCGRPPECGDPAEYIYGIAILNFRSVAAYLSIHTSRRLPSCLWGTQICSSVHKSPNRKEK